MLVVGGHDERDRRGRRLLFVTVDLRGFRRFEVNGIAGDDRRRRDGEPRAGARPARHADPAAEGHHRRREIPWPGDWSLDRLGARGWRPTGRAARPSARTVPGAGRVGRMTSVMRATMWRQPADLRGLLGDPGPIEEQAERLAGRRILAVGTGRAGTRRITPSGCSGRRASRRWACRRWSGARTAAGADDDDALLVLSHRNTKRFSTEVLERVAGRAGAGRGRRRRGLAGRRHRDRRAGALCRLHRQPPRRPAAARAARDAPRRIAAELDGVPDAVEAALEREPRRPAADQAARADRRRPEPVDRRRGRAEGARDIACRDRRARRSSSSSTAPRSQSTSATRSSASTGAARGRSARRRGRRGGGLRDSRAR